MAGFLLLAQEPLQFVTARGRTEGYDTVDSSAAIQILYTLVCFVYSTYYLFLPRNKSAVRILLGRPVVFLTLFTVLCMVSALWSPSPVYTAFMAFQCLSYLMLVVVVLHEVRRRCISQDVIEWAMLWIVWTIFWAVVYTVQWAGIVYLLYPFYSARLSTGIFFFLALYLCRRRFLGWVVVAFAILSISNKNYFGILPGVLSAAVLGDKKSKILTLVVVGLITASVLYFGMENVVQNTLFYGKAGVGWEYTTGRDKVFSLGWELCLKRPFFGYGFVAGEREILLGTYRGAMSMHNMFLSAFMGVGLLGPALLLLYFIGMLRLCLSKGIPTSWRFAFTATVFVVFVVSMTGPGLGSRVYGSWLASVVVMTAITILCKDDQTQAIPVPGPIV